MSRQERRPDGRFLLAGVVERVTDDVKNIIIKTLCSLSIQLARLANARPSWILETSLLAQSPLPAESNR